MNEPGIPTVIFFFIVVPTAMFFGTLASRFAHTVYDFFHKKEK